MTGLAPRRGLATGALFLLLISPVWADLDTATGEALRDAYYELEVASYCGLVSDAVAAGFQRQVQRILGDAVVEQETLNHLRGTAWQAAHWEWQNRGLGGLPRLVPQGGAGRRWALPDRAPLTQPGAARYPASDTNWSRR